MSWDCITIVEGYTWEAKACIVKMVKSANMNKVTVAVCWSFMRVFLAIKNKITQLIPPIVNTAV